ncbi:biopolymer transporter ExbD [Bradyrhizobium ontarionense]|uniref:Biopolymer transporter ExbD n=1 Tax=Bradyrhizobium ontarionense TaxID=2898149 RepID=A0ABY3R2Y8_9BRAD|nr:biopolymer transporter ExbD [Bradyrhizobium sp. A19]UFZ01407.1 biopolymer transporter ExbD [Bradyrhizobium sp. A19]
MGMSTGSASGGGGRRGRRKAAVMAEINVTPMVDVMLVLLIIFMVAAPLLTVNIQVDLPQAQGGSASTADAKPPLEVTVKKTGGGCASKVDVYLGETQIAINELGPKIKAIKEANTASGDNVVKIRGDRDACYSDMMKVLGLARDAGYRASIVVLPEQGS